MKELSCKFGIRVPKFELLKAEKFQISLSNLDRIHDLAKVILRENILKRDDLCLQNSQILKLDLTVLREGREGTFRYASQQEFSKILELAQAKGSSYIDLTIEANLPMFIVNRPKRAARISSNCKSSSCFRSSKYEGDSDSMGFT